MLRAKSLASVLQPSVSDDILCTILVTPTGSLVSYATALPPSIIEPSNNNTSTPVTTTTTSNDNQQPPSTTKPTSILLATSPQSTTSTTSTSTTGSSASSTSSESSSSTSSSTSTSSASSASSSTSSSSESLTSSITTTTLAQPTTSEQPHHREPPTIIPEHSAKIYAALTANLWFAYQKSLRQVAASFHSQSQQDSSTNWTIPSESTGEILSTLTVESEHGRFVITKIASKMLVCMVAKHAVNSTVSWEMLKQKLEVLKSFLEPQLKKLSV